MRYIYFLLALMPFLFACSDKEQESQNTAPECSITNPVNGTTHGILSPLVIKGTGSDKENNISVVTLTVGDKVIEQVTALPFEYSVKAEELTEGELKITLSVKDSKGLSDKDEITITILDNTPPGILTPKELNFGYWTDESKFTIYTDKRWTLSIPSNDLVAFFNDVTGEWERGKTQVTGEGKTVLKVKVAANNLFSAKKAEFTLTTVEENVKFTVSQVASPDMMELIEDDMLRMAADMSISMYGMDTDGDRKISAYEAEIEPSPGVPYGFDAGGLGIESTKGIENFPQLRHLDVNRNLMTEIDLSGNTNLLSIHVHGCKNLKTLDLSHTPKLMELLSEFELFLTIEPDIMKMKKQLHTIGLGVLGRKPESRSTLDFSGFSSLQRLYLDGNDLTELKLQGCSSLWRLIAMRNKFTELDISELDTQTYGDYLMDNNPNLKKLYVWSGFDRSKCSNFSLDEGVEIVEK